MGPFKSQLILLILQLVSVLIFCAGFFPKKNVLKGNASFQIEPEKQANSPAVFDKLVVVVIDALRSDFLFDAKRSHFPFVHDLLNNGNAWGFTAYSNPPTVTLPRLKGITTGSTPNFLDAILNVAEDDTSSNLKNQDSLLSQLNAHGKKMRFFGDDTWLKLFPLEYFEEYEGTNSFFVSDFIQVDHNVTRHVPKQLQEINEWDMLILHYLGLDHIGHKGGANSSFMPDKHIEMDNVIKSIYEQISDDTLLVVLGDHGMNELGNHGGSSQGETSSALLFSSPKLSKYEVPEEQKGLKFPMNVSLAFEEENNYQYIGQVQQVDIVPTLATLFNLPIPKNSVGIIIEPFLRLLKDKSMPLLKLKENYLQLSQLANNDMINDELNTLDALFSEMGNIQSELMRSATNYRYIFLFIGIGVLCIITIACFVYASKEMLFNTGEIITLVSAILIGLSAFGSSFVEEEHQIWWWIITGLLTISLFYHPQKKLIHAAMFICVRIIRGWNNSGQKYIYPNTISNMFKTEYTELMWYLIVFSIWVVGFKNSMKNFPTFAITFMLSAMTITFKACSSIANNETVPYLIMDAAKTAAHLIVQDQKPPELFSSALVPEAQLFFHCVLGFLFLKSLIQLFHIDKSVDNIFDELTRVVSITLIFQTAPANIPMYAIFEVLKYLLMKLMKDEYNSNPYLIGIISFVLQNFTYFQFGGTNSIATIDLSNAYNGVSENYNIYYVGLLMAISNFAPAIYWSSSTWQLLYGKGTNHATRMDNFIKSKLPILLFNCITGLCLLISCFALRYHLFIWSVFSPKLGYYVMWNVFMNFIVGWVVESILVLSHY